MFFVTNCLGVDYRSHRRSAEIQWRSAVAEVSGDQRRTAEVSAGPPEVQRRSISQKSCKFRYCSGMEPKKSCKCVFLLFVAPTQARSQKNRTSACFQRFQTLSAKNMKNRKKTKKNVKKLTRFRKTTNSAKQAKKAAASGGQRRSAEVQRRFGGSKLHQITKSMKIIDLRVFWLNFYFFSKFCVIERFLRFARTNKKNRTNVVLFSTR